MDYLKLATPWTMGDPRTLARTRVFDLLERHCASVTTDGKAGDFVYLDASDWVNVIPLTPQREVVMIEQFRPGIGAITLEVPGGMVDPGETPADAAARELAEETGYAGGPVEMIGRVTPNPAIQNNYCHTGLVRDVVLTETIAFDSHEEIAVRLVPLDEIPSLIKCGIIDHALVICAFHHLALMTPPV
jgi:ADP-ribose pyrophosphatase